MGEGGAAAPSPFPGRSKFSAFRLVSVSAGEGGHINGTDHRRPAGTRAERLQLPPPRATGSGELWDRLAMGRPSLGREGRKKKQLHCVEK